MEPTNLQKAISIANKASEADQSENYKEAILLYQKAVQFFLHILKREPQGKDGNQKIRNKCKEYLDRVEELKEYTEEKEVFVKSNAEFQENRGTAVYVSLLYLYQDILNVNI